MEFLKESSFDIPLVLYAETLSSFDGNSIINIRYPRVLSLSIFAKSLVKNSPLTEGNQS